MTTSLLGTPETSLSGRRTLNALSAFMSNPPPFSPTWASTPLKWLIASIATENNLGRAEERHVNDITRHSIKTLVDQVIPLLDTVGVT